MASHFRWKVILIGALGLWLMGGAGCSKSDTSEKPDESAASSAPAEKSVESGVESGTGESAKPASTVAGPAEAPREEAPADPMFMTARQLRERLEAAPPVVVVDVRRDKPFEAFHLPGAIHMAAHELKVSAAVKAGPVVVMGYGHGADGLTDVVGKLREEGRDVKLLYGGMQAWCRLGGKTTTPCRGEARLTPHAMARGLIDEARLVVFAAKSADPASEAAKETVAEVLPAAEVLEYTTPEDFADKLKKLAAAKGARQVVVADAEGTGYFELKQAAAPRVDAHLFYLDRGVAGYQEFKKGQAAMLDRRTIVSQGVGSSRSKPGRPKVVRAPKGCGCM